MDESSCKVRAPRKHKKTSQCATGTTCAFSFYLSSSSSVQWIRNYWVYTYSIGAPFLGSTHEETTAATASHTHTQLLKNHIDHWQRTSTKIQQSAPNNPTTAWWALTCLAIDPRDERLMTLLSPFQTRPGEQSQDVIKAVIPPRWRKQSCCSCAAWWLVPGRPQLTPKNWPESKRKPFWLPWAWAASGERSEHDVMLAWETTPVQRVRIPFIILLG